MFLLWLLWCFYQLFGLSFWRHPFTAEDTLVNKRRNATFLQICSDEETNSSWMAWVKFQQMFTFDWTIPLMIKQPGKSTQEKFIGGRLSATLMMDRCVTWCQVFSGRGLSVWLSTVVSSGGTLCFQNAALLPKLFLWQLPWKLGDSDSP